MNPTVEQLSRKNKGNIRASSVDHLIRKGGDPILKAICDPVEPGEPLPFIEKMIRVCHKAPGYGLAAPQIGVAKRVIFTLVRPDGLPPPVGRVFINPVIEWSSEETDSYREGCLSYPGIMRDIVRPVAIRLRYEDKRRVAHVEEIRGFLARVVQHEVDHLFGVCRVGDPDGENIEKMEAITQGRS